MRFSIRLNNDIGVDEFVRIAVLAEELGFDQVWVSHDLLWRSAPVLATAAALATKRIAIGVGVFNPVSRHVAEIAMDAATLHEVSGGRALLGIGAGADRFFDWVRLDRDRPAPRMRTAVVQLRALLAGEVPEGWDREGRLRIGPANVPIYVGAMGPKLLELAGELADGALPLLFPPEHYTTAVEQITAGLDRVHRDPSSIDVAACVWCSIDADRALANRALAEKIAYYGASFSPHLLARAGLRQNNFPREMTADQVTAQMLSLGIAGDAAEVTERCRTLVAAGATHISFGPPLGPDPLRAVSVLGREVIPKL